MPKEVKNQVTNQRNPNKMVKFWRLAKAAPSPLWLWERGRAEAGRLPRHRRHGRGTSPRGPRPTRPEASRPREKVTFAVTLGPLFLKASAAGARKHRHATAPSSAGWAMAPAER